MCLIAFNYLAHPHYKLIIAANRDEFYGRPTAKAQYWDNHPNILAGRDLLKYGTWLGITKQGRFAALTNYRNPAHMNGDKNSRGEIISNYLQGHTSADAYIDELHQQREQYNGYNLLIGEPDNLLYYNNIEGKQEVISHGTHALSNHFLNTPWPKVINSKKMVHQYIMTTDVVNPDKLFDILFNNEIAEDHQLPNTGIAFDLEQQLSPLFIRTPEYGTRCSTVILVNRQNKVQFIERTYDNGAFSSEERFSFQIESSLD